MDTIKKNDLIYLFMGILIAAIGGISVGSPDTTVGLYGLLGLLGVALVMAIIIKPSLGANILILAIFTNISDQLTKRDFPSVIKPLAPIVAIAIVIHYLYMEQAPRGNTKTRRIEMFIFLYFMAVTASFLVASNRSRALNEIFDFGKDLIIVYCILFALRQMKSWRQSAWVIVVTTGILSILGLYQTITGNYSQNFFGLASVNIQGVFDGSTTPRLGGPINAPNLWGQVITAVIPLVVYRVLHATQAWRKFLALAILGFLLIGLLNTYSRGAYLALVAVLVLIFFEKRVNPFLMASGVAVVAVLIIILPSNYVQRFQSLSALSLTNENGIYQDSSFRGRTSELLAGLWMFADHPILGVGAGNYRVNYQQYAQLVGIETRAEERDPHSLYVQLLAETGIFGTLAFLGMAFSLLSGLARAKKSIAALPIRRVWLPWLSAIQLSIIGYLVASTFLHGAYIRYFWIFVALAISAIQLTDEWIENFVNKSSSLKKHL